MKLTTKRNRRYFWKEFFSYIIPIILITGTIDVFYNFMRCPLHPEWSAPCSVNWIIGIMYGIPLILVMILAIISASKLKKVKKQIENEFLGSTDDTAEIKEISNKLQESKLKKNIEKTNQKKSLNREKTEISPKKTTSKKTIKNNLQ